MNMTAAKMQVFLNSLPRDLAAHVVFSAISMSSEKLAKAIEMAVALNAMRVLDRHNQEAGLAAKKIVEDTMEEFTSKMDSEMYGESEED